MQTRIFTQHLCFLLPLIASSIRIGKIQVPRYQLAGTDLQLNCTYNLRSDGKHEDPLYSVKWYRGADHFYEFVPTRHPQLKSFHFPGLEVDLGRSMKSSVVLTSVSEKTSGVFRCEVMGDKPYFETDSKRANMTVIEPPVWVPEIQGVKDNSHVRSGDRISVMCTVSVSRPPANLTWILNDRRSPVDLETPAIRTADSLGRPLIETKLDLHLDQSSFVKGVLQIECRAALYDIWQRTHKIVLHDIDRPKPAGIGWWFSSGCKEFLPPSHAYTVIGLIILWIFRGTK